MSNISKYKDLIDDLKDEGSINEPMILALVLRAAFDRLGEDDIDDILAEAEVWQIAEWEEQDRRNAENRRVVATHNTQQGVAA